MLRRWLPVVALTAALSALLGVAFSDRPLLAAGAAAGAGLVVAGLLSAAVERRVAQAAARLSRLPGDDGAAGAATLTGDRAAWERLDAAIAEAQARFQDRVDALVDERARVERLLEAFPTAVLLFTVDGLAYANPTARALFGLTRAGARSPLQALGVEGLAHAVTEVRETGRTVTVEVTRDERQLLARASLAAEGEVALVVTDLTEARRVETVRRDFVTNASHELKTPVAGMQALAGSLSMAFERHPERARRMIERLQQESSRLAQLVRDLLDLARLEEDTTGGAGMRRVDLGQLVRDQADRLAGLAADVGVTLRCDGVEAARLVGSPGDLRLIVTNLLENAIRYNRPGGKVHVSVRRSGADIVLEVADNGIGIPEADQDRIFERFYRVDKGRSRAAGGTGLGLSIVRHASQRHGGDVGVTSVLGEGSTFRVVLPVEGSSSRG
ncbi:MAG: ATP-binding protein [Actinomycetota bacterium]|nr:ATP-binding protein [Actinomycetota bacterium]